MGEDIKDFSSDPEKSLIIKKTYLDPTLTFVGGKCLQVFLISFYPFHFPFPLYNLNCKSCIIAHNIAEVYIRQNTM